MRSLPRLWSTLLLASAVVTTSPVPAAADNFTVNTTADASDANPSDGVCATAAGQCSLRAAIDQANFDPAVDTIVVPSGEYHPTLGHLALTNSATVQGAGALTTIIDPDTSDRIFRIESGAAVTISELTMRGGSVIADHGGAITNLGSLTLSSVILQDNVAGQSGGAIDSTVGSNSLAIDRSTISGNQASNGNGGAITFQSAGSLTITNSTITDNSATIDGGGIYDAALGGTVSISNTTITGNRANGGGGGIHSSSTATIASTTITNNRADHDSVGGGDGGGVVDSGFGTLTLRRTIVAGNTDASPGAEAPDCSGGPMSGGSNLIGNTTGCGYTADGADKVDMSAVLGPLADNGGPTMTHALLTGSPAIDAVTGACEAADQRGVPRPQGAACDIGGYELALCGGVAVNRLALDAVPFVGTPGPDVVLGMNGNDTIDGGDGDDRLCGGSGDDRLTGGAGNDALDGGAGTDRVVEGGDVNFLLRGSVLSGSGTDSLAGIEKATLMGGAGDNLLDASTFPGTVELIGGGGDDGFIPGPLDDVIDGGAGIFDTVLAGGNVNFTITDGTLIGLGSDAIQGIEGALIVGESSGNTIDASSFNGTLFASGGGGADTILGGRSGFGDLILGDGGNDLIRGGGGPDLIFGGGQKDRLAGQAGSDLIRGEGGSDSLLGGAGKDRLFGGGGRDAMDGGPGKDVCNGGRKPDTARRCEKVRKL